MGGLVLLEGPVCGPVDLPLPPLVHGLYLATQLCGASKIALEPEGFSAVMRGRGFSVEDQLNFVSEFKPDEWSQMRWAMIFFEI
jgi:hypothetical protein